MKKSSLTTVCYVKKQNFGVEKMHNLKGGGDDGTSDAPDDEGAEEGSATLPDYAD